MNGLVTKSTGSWYTVLLENGVSVDCRIRGKLRLDEQRDSNPVAVGDHVTIDRDPEMSETVISEVLQRRNYIIRQSPKKKGLRHVVAANLDQVLLIATVSNPRTSHGFIDRVLMVAEAFGIPAILLFNKTDLYSREKMEKLRAMMKVYAGCGYTSIPMSAATGENLDEVERIAKGKISLIAGHSGVGKTTLINALCGGEKRRTDEVSRITGKGKHVTTFAEMIPLASGGYLVDIPGVKEFGIAGIFPEEVSAYFPEMRDLRGNCRFSNCRHNQEPGCAIVEAARKGIISPERHSSYLGIIEELEELNRWEI